MSNATHPVALSATSFERLAAIAEDRETSVDELLEEAVALFLAEHAETMAAFEEGIRQIEAGQFYTNEEVRAHLDTFLHKRNAA